MSTNLIGDTNDKRAAAQRPQLPQLQANFTAPADTPPLEVPAVLPPVQPPGAADPAAAFDPFAPVDVSGLQSGTLPLVPTAGQTPLQLQEQIVAPLEKAGITDLQQSEAARLDESAQQQDISILNYSPPDIEGMVNVGNERINSLIQQLDLQDRQRKAEAQDKYKGVSLADAMMQLDKEPEQGTLQRVFKQVGDYFGGAVFTDPRDGRQYTTPYVALTQRELGLPVTQKDGPPNIAGGLLYGLNAIGAAPLAFAKDRLDQVNRTVHDVTQMMPWLKGTQDAATRWMQRNAPALAAQALKKRDEGLARTAPGGTSNMMTMLRGGNYSLTDEMSTGSIGKIPGTKIDVDPGSLVGFAADVATGELVERGISAIVKQGVPALARTTVRGVTLPTLSSRAARRTRPAARPPTPGGALARTTTRPVVQGELVEDIITPAPPKQRAIAGKPPEVKAATIPDYRAVVVRPAGRGTGKAVVPTNPDRPVVVQTIQAVPDPVGPTRAYRSAPTPKYNQPKPTGPGGQFELPLTGVVQMPTVTSLLDDAPVRAAAVDAQQLTLPGVLPERQQFGMLGVEFHPDNTVVFKGLDDMFEDGDVIAARSFFKDLAEQGQTPLVKLTADLDETAWDNGFINALHMGFKPVANDGSFVNPNLIEFGSDVTLQLTPPGSVRVKRTNTVEDVLQRPDGARPYETVEPGNTLVESGVPVGRTDDVPSPAVRDDNARPYETAELGDTLVERAVPGTSSALVRRTDSLVGNVPSPAARELVTEGANSVPEIDDTLPSMAELFRRAEEIAQPNTVEDILQRTDSLVDSVPSPAALELYETIEVMRDVYPSVAAVGEDMSTRTLIGSLKNVDISEGDPTLKYRVLRDAGERGGEDFSVKKFGDVELTVSHTYGDLYEIGFTVAGEGIRVAGGKIPYSDLNKMVKHIIDLHKAHPAAGLTAGIDAVSKSEWLMKFRMYRRAGFVAVDELDMPITFRVEPEPFSFMKLRFDPSSVDSSVLARRIADTPVAIPGSAADPAFVQLSGAVQMKEAIEELRRSAEKVADLYYDAYSRLELPPRITPSGIENRLNVKVKYVDLTPLANVKPTYMDLYHGTRVVSPDVSKLQHIDGGSASAIGVGFHLTENVNHANYHAMKAVNPDLPLDVQREYGPPTVSRYVISQEARILSATKSSPLIADIVRQIVEVINPDDAAAIPRSLSVTSAINIVDNLLVEPELTTPFQRAFSEALRDAGVDVIEAGPNSRVVLNPEVLYDDALNVPVTFVHDYPTAPAKYAYLASSVDFDDLPAPRNYVDKITNQLYEAEQDIHEIAVVQREIADRIDDAISRTTLWDYNGVPDPDNIPRYRPDPEPPLRNAATPFDTQTADISPCTL